MVDGFFVLCYDKVLYFDNLMIRFCAPLAGLGGKNIE